MAMPSTTRQFSNVIASKPKPRGEASTAPNSTELQEKITKLLENFEELHRMQELSLTDKKLVAVRRDIEKAMPHLYQLTNKSGPPYPSKRMCDLKGYAENCLREFNVDLDALRPKVRNVVKTVPCLATVGASPCFPDSSRHVNFPANRAKQQLSQTQPDGGGMTTMHPALPPRMPSQLNAPLRNVALSSLTTQPNMPLRDQPLVFRASSSPNSQQGGPTSNSKTTATTTTMTAATTTATATVTMTTTTATLSACQKTLLWAVQDVMNNMSGLGWSDDTKNECKAASSNCKSSSDWIEAPVALSPEEIACIDESAQMGDGGTIGGGGASSGAAAGAGGNGMGVMSMTDGRGQFSSAFGRVQAGYMQSVPGAFHQHVNK